MKKIRQVFANRGVEAEYRSKLDKLVDAMYKSVLYWLLIDTSHKSVSEIAKQLQKRIKQWKKVFGSNSDKIALWFVQSVQKHTETGMRTALLQSGYTPNVKTPKRIVEAIKQENIGLIKSIPDKFFDGIEVVAMMAILYSWDSTQLSDNITKKYKVAIRRNRIISSDQNHKANQLIKLGICESLKIKYGEWVYTWRSETPRESHIEMNGTIFDLNVGCYDKNVGRYIFPAEEYNCKCDFRPLVEEPGDDLRKLVDKNRYYQQVAKG